MKSRVTMKESTSASGREAQTPSCPQNLGSTSRNGSRKSIWRVRERKMARRAFPMAWKKLPMMIWLPMSGKASTQMVRPLAARLMSAASSVKSPAMPRGKKTQARKPSVVKEVPASTPYLRVSRTRPGFMAPWL